MLALLKDDRLKLVRASVLVWGAITVALYLLGVPLYFGGLASGCVTRMA